MRKSLLIISGVVFSFISTSMLAGPRQASLQPNSAAITSSDSSTSDQQQVLLYEQPDVHSTVVAKLSPVVHLVPIFQQQGWVKVGNSMDGQVGWVNINQYHQARAAFFKPNVQTMFIQIDHDSQGKPTVNVIAYKNGHKVNAKEAQALYAQVKQHQETQFHQMERFSQAFDEMFDADITNIQHGFANSWYPFSWVHGVNDMQPIIVFPAIDISNAPSSTSNPSPTLAPKK